MQQGITLIGAVPMRKWPGEASEMVTHVLFGETFDILDIQDNWTQVKMHYDGENGWIDTKTWEEITEDLSILYQSDECRTLSNVCKIKEHSENDYPMTLFPGSSIPNISATKKEFSISGHVYQFIDEPEFKENKSNLRHAIVKNALTFMNSPYLWGGRAFYGIDCSGLTQVVYKIFGIRITRNSYQQIKMGHTVEFIREAQPGDLAFFDDKEGNIKHVGILLDQKRIIHASGLVRIDKIDHQGIYHEGKNKYTHKLRLIKSYI